MAPKPHANPHRSIRNRKSDDLTGVSNYTRGRNLFGPGLSFDSECFRSNLAYLQQVETVVLNDGVFIPSACIVYSDEHGFYKASMDGFTDSSESNPKLRGFDRIFHYSGDDLSLANDVPLEYVDEIAIPVCGHGVFNYGHFLFDGLAGVLLLIRLCAPVRIVIVGPPLRVWQAEILDLLGLLTLYRPIIRPTRFRRLIATNMLSLNVAYPNRITRSLFDEMLYRVGGTVEKTRRILYISRKESDKVKRRLINRDEVDATFAGWGFEVIYPEKMSVVEQIKLFSTAVIVAGESGAAMANIGFCPPGTRVLEIQPECFVEGWTRANCLVFGHEWLVYFAQQSGADIASIQQDKTKVHEFEFIVDIPELTNAIQCLRDRHHYRKNSRSVPWELEPG